MPLEVLVNWKKGLRKCDIFTLLNSKAKHEMFVLPTVHFIQQLRQPRVLVI